MPGIIHYLDGDRENHAPDNLAVLCPRHLREALPSGDKPPTLAAEEIRQRKTQWERGCLTVLMSLARPLENNR